MEFRGFFTRLENRGLEILRIFLEALLAHPERPDRDGVAGLDDVRSDFVELHGHEGGRFVLESVDDAGLDGVVDFEVVHRGRLHADGAEYLGLDRGGHDAEDYRGGFLHVGDGFAKDEVPGAAAAVPEDAETFFQEVVLDGLECGSGGEHLVPSERVSIEEGRIE